MMPANRLTKFDGRDYALIGLLDSGMLTFRHAMQLRTAPKVKWQNYDEAELHGDSSTLCRMD